MPIEITLPMPDDWHVHLRDGDMLEAVRPFTECQFRNFLPMPNLTPPLTDAVDVSLYREQIAGSGYGQSVLAGRIHPTLYLTSRTTPRVVEEVAAYIRAAKYYPHGGTTNSGSGLSSPQDLDYNVLRTMEALGIVLCVHAELTPDVEPDDLKREFGFIPHLEWLVMNYPDLKIVVEHVSDHRMLQAVLDMPANVAATITAHHPFLTHEMAVRDSHCLCMPVAKTASDRDALAHIILGAHLWPGKIFFGSDSAPHAQVKKLGGAPAFGAWTSPVAIPVLWNHFDVMGDRHKWEAFVAFTCSNGAAFYGIESDRPRPQMTLVRERWQVPEVWPIGRHDRTDASNPEQVLVPWKAGEVLDWRVDSMRWFGEVYED